MYTDAILLSLLHKSDLKTFIGKSFIWSEFFFALWEKKGVKKNSTAGFHFVKRIIVGFIL